MQTHRKSKLNAQDNGSVGDSGPQLVPEDLALNSPSPEISPEMDELTPEDLADLREAGGSLRRLGVDGQPIDSAYVPLMDPGPRWFRLMTGADAYFVAPIIYSVEDISKTRPHILLHGTHSRFSPSRIKIRRIMLGVFQDAESFLWMVWWYGLGEAPAKYHVAMGEIIQSAQSVWTRKEWVKTMDGGEHKGKRWDEDTQGIAPAAVWPAASWDDILKRSFRGRLITKHNVATHPLLKEEGLEVR